MVLGCTALGFALAPETAHAEADTFGLGNGQDGPKTAGAAEVVNSYARLAQNVAAGGSQLTIGTVIGNGGAFAANDLVLVWRATGSAASAAQPPAIADRFATRLNLASTTGGAIGTYEFARIQTVVGSTITLTKPLVRAFEKDVSQVVKVPEYTNVTVPASMSLRAQPWQASDTGFAGGILVFLASGTVTLTGTGKLDADGAGFRGGEKVQRLLNLPLGCPNEDGTPANGYANKGEGIVSAEFGDAKGGRGNWSLAAGGGNCVESGGGGGGNAGNGGAGGDSFVTSGRGGRGGVGIDYSLFDRITIGGGGGAGEQKNGVGSSGGNGGGAIFVRAQTMTGTGTVTANGSTAENAGVFGVESDGAGGGGAGGSIVVRTASTLDCGGMAARGGNGGNTSVIGLGFWGPGGGGGGGRALIHGSSVGANCTANVSPGNNGTSGSNSNGATGGQNGSTQPPPTTGGFCFNNPSPQCVDPTPVCNVPTGACSKCNGPFESNASLACPVKGEPVCLGTGACVPCNGDFGSGTSQACQLSKSPTCLSGAQAGECGKCTSDNDCVGPGHLGPKCQTSVGACGTGCTTDADCKGNEWCGLGVCLVKTPNGDPLPNITPIDGECTDQKGQRVCSSAVCEETDDLCGLKNSSPCTTQPECRSNICFPGDGLCGKPIGEPCTGNFECRSDLCQDGVCSNPCNSDVDCATGQVCEATSHQCVPGCRPGLDAGVAADGGANHGGCPSGQECVSLDGSPIGECKPTGDSGTGALDAGTSDGGAGDDGGNGLDAGDTYRAGLVEGGGCACGTTPGSGSANNGVFATLGTAIAALFVARRRRDRSDRRDR